MKNKFALQVITTREVHMKYWTVDTVEEFIDYESDLVEKELEKYDPLYAAYLVKAFLIMRAFIDTHKMNLTDFITETYPDEEKFSELLTAVFVSENAAMKYFLKILDPHVRQDPT